MFDVRKFVAAGKKIVGAGLNYKSLVTEKNVPIPQIPILFLKPTSSYIVKDQAIKIPENFEVHHEIELGIIIGKHCRKVTASQARDYIGGYCLALDLTAVSELNEARKKGLPWSIGKGFDTACPVSEPLDKDCISNPDDIQIWCSVNDEMKQNCNTSDMVFSTSELVSYISNFMTLEPYDLILTGSPKGVGPIKPGDIIKGGLGDLVQIDFQVE